MPIPFFLAAMATKDVALNYSIYSKAETMHCTIEAGIIRVDSAAS
jgi:hypothetical protein